MLKKSCLMLLATLLLAACGSSQLVSKPMEKAVAAPSKFRVESIVDHSGRAIPSQFIASVKGYLESDLTKRNLLGAEDDSTARIRIDIQSYRMRSGIGRMMFGMMAGKDGLASNVSVLAPTGDTVLGESKVSTFNVMAVGGESDIARMHAAEIGKFLTGETEDKKK